MALLRLDTLAGMLFELELEMALALRSQSILIGYICFQEIHDILLAPLLLWFMLLLCLKWT
jgi:hypothetical protein